MKSLISTVLLGASVLTAAPAASDTSDRAPDWQEQAKRHLLGFQGLANNQPTVPVDDAYLAAAGAERARRMRESAARRDPPRVLTDAEIEDGTFRCVRKNNYFCLKNGSRWPGVLGQDREGHAVFEKPEHAARAKVSVMRRLYQRCNFKTLDQVINVYAPPDDCIGSGFGRTPDGRCVRNDPGDYALFLGRRMGISATEDARLFDAAGNATEQLRLLMTYSPIYETGFFLPKGELIEQGIALEAHDRQDLLARQEHNVAIPGCP